MLACPHCRARAAIEPSRALRWRCSVCGGAVIPTVSGSARSHEELPSLVGAQRARGVAFGWTVAACVLGAVTCMTSTLAVVLSFASHLASVVLAAVAAIAGSLAVVSWRGASRSNDEAAAKLDDAWSRVANDVLSASGAGRTAAQLAAVMNVDVTYAERLLARLSAEGRARVDVRDDAELAYRGTEDGDGSPRPASDVSHGRAR